MKRNLALVAAFLLGVSIGAGICTRIHSPYRSWLIHTSTDNAMSSFAAVQFYQGTPASALRAQQEYSSFLDNVEKNRSNWNEWRVPWMSEMVLGYERVLTNGRIALLLESAGDATASEKHWAIAESQAAKLGWKHTDREHVRRIVNSLRSAYGKPEEP